MLSQRRPGKMFRNAYYLHVEQAQAGTIVTLRGSMAENGAAAVMSEVVKATRTHAILLNLGHTRHIGADGLGVLLEARRIAQARGQQFSLLGVSRSLRRAFKYAQVEQILSATPNTQEVFVPAPRRNNGGRGMAVGQRAAAIQQTA
jgi:anti-anti-sigma factor